jgi:uncharacterized phage-associated protein
MPAEVDSGVEIALWFSDQALHRNEYVQPQKLHKLLFLAQAYFAVAYGGRKLMPCCFVAEELGPIEPTIYKVFARGRPDVEPDIFLTEAAQEFLTSFWRRFGHFTPSKLARLTNGSDAYRQALARGRRAEISHDAMRLSFARSDVAPDVSQIVRPKVLRTATGRPVTVRAWRPADPERLDDAMPLPRVRNADVKNALALRQGAAAAEPGPQTLKESPVIKVLAEELMTARRKRASP